MDNFPFVSLVVLNYNGGHILPEFFAALEKLAYPEDKLETIFVDDGSTDDSVYFVRENYPDVKVIRNDKNIGPAESRNKGIKETRGKFIAFLDNDCFVTPQWLAQLVKAMQADPDIGIAASKLLFEDRRDTINSAGGIINRYADAYDRGVYERDSGQFEKDERVFYGCSAAMLIRSSVIGRTGLFDVDYFYLYEDVDFGWRVNLAGYKVVYVHSAVAYHKLSHTMGRGSLKIKYFLERNRLLTVLKNYGLAALLKYGFAFARERPKKFLKYKTQGRLDNVGLFWMGLRAWLWNFVNIAATCRKRRQVQRVIRKLQDSEIWDIIYRLNFTQAGSIYENSNRS